MDPLKKVFTGGCQCGAVRYRAERANTDAYYCHCRMCQKAFGNLFATFFTLDKKEVVWTTGEPTYYASSKIARRGFCARCGTPLCFLYIDDDPTMDLSVGSLDHPEQMHPTIHWGVESRVPSFEWQDELPQLRTEDEEKFVRKWQAAYENPT